MENINGNVIVDSDLFIGAFVEELLTQITEIAITIIDENLRLFDCIKDPEIFKERVISESSIALSLFFEIENTSLLKKFVEFLFDALEDNGI